MQKITAKIILDSISEDGVRLTTFHLHDPRYILPEIDTHRMLSKNSRSSRARPINSVMKEVYDDPFIPSHWTAYQKGMQGKEITDPEAIEFYTNFITSLGKNIVDAIELFNETCDIKGIPRLHKQILNRYIENFASTDTIISGTDWKNFFNLRISDKAEPHIKELAEAMQKAMAESTPKVVTIGDYHLPYITEDEIEHHFMTECKFASVARCARVSYAPFGSNEPDFDKDLELGKTLLQDKHMSAFEHIATPLLCASERTSNFRGWKQYRQEVDYFSREV